MKVRVRGAAGICFQRREYKKLAIYSGETRLILTGRSQAIVHDG